MGPALSFGRLDAQVPHEQLKGALHFEGRGRQSKLFLAKMKCYCAKSNAVAVHPVHITRFPRPHAMTKYGENTHK